MAYPEGGKVKVKKKGTVEKYTPGKDEFFIEGVTFP